MRFVELFAGIGGFSLGFERAGMECVGHVEIDKYAQKVLKKHWPKVPLYSDVTKITGDEFGKVDLICGGFPCQPFSTLGTKKGKKDERYLLPSMLEIIKKIKPSYAIFENVIAFRKELDDLSICLEKEGYKTESFIIPANAFGLPHQRKRLFIVAHFNGKPSEQAYKTSLSESIKRGAWMGHSRQTRAIISRIDWPKSKPGICRRDDGFSSGVDRLKCLGNSLVPAIAEFIGKQLLRGIG